MRGRSCRSFLHIDLPMTVGFQQLEVVDEAVSGPATPAPGCDWRLVAVNTVFSPDFGAQNTSIIINEYRMKAPAVQDPLFTTPASPSQIANRH